ncbi:MAG: 30S ribosomal protein S4 [Bacteroidales bacterium]|jgi:small subunit ribosomal protein S4|nr:30S ribosomal protein S4 [Bacteroidales bacterium]
MARYIGPKTKIARKFKEPIYGPDKAYDRRSYPPGQHGNSHHRGKRSEYEIQLMAKQKAKYTYGILERQFRNLYKAASRKGGITGEILLQMCESRLDNVVYRLGIAPSRAAARQLVSHRHIIVDGEVVNIPSYQLKAGQTIGVREKSKSLEAITASLSYRTSYSWLEWDEYAMTGKFMHIPLRVDIPENIKEQLIVELYSK